MFLGADVLATSQQPVNHHVRIHSRYAKLGLATKVTMNGMFAVHGETKRDTYFGIYVKKLFSLYTV